MSDKTKATAPPKQDLSSSGKKTDEVKNEAAISKSSDPKKATKSGIDVFIPSFGKNATELSQPQLLARLLHVEHNMLNAQKKYKDRKKVRYEAIKPILNKIAVDLKLVKNSIDENSTLKLHCENIWTSKNTKDLRRMLTSILPKNIDESLVKNETGKRKRKTNEKHVDDSTAITKKRDTKVLNNDDVDGEMKELIGFAKTSSVTNSIKAPSHETHESFEIYRSRAIEYDNRVKVKDDFSDSRDNYF